MLSTANTTLSQFVADRVAAARAGLRTVRSLHEDEEGLSTVEMILLLFIGVVIIVAILSFFWDSIWPRVELVVEELFETAEQGQ